MSRRVLALIFGGRSPEHEVSVVSARGIFANLDNSRWDVRLVGVTRGGEARVGGPELLDQAEVTAGGVAATWPSHPERRAFHAYRGELLTPAIDIAFPIIHGAGGEDGTLQGILASAGIPFVGSGVLGSSLAMDKDRCRRILAAAGIPVVEDLVFEGPAALEFAKITQQAERLGYPLFVKPARAGSSVGINKVRSAQALIPALEAAYAVDTKILLERAIPEARELETAVLGNLDPRASIVGEVVPHGEFYDYHAKYHDPDSRLLIPAPIDSELSERIRGLAVRAFRELDLMGMARVDFLYGASSGELVLNEPNTLPGFTPISMYPKLWEATGLPYPQLLNRLIELALESASLGALRSS